MPSTQDIKEAFTRGARALSLRSTIGRGTAVSKTRVVDGLRCEIQDGSWTLQADLNEKGGGGGTAPDPGVLGRAALGTCLAMTYTRWAAVLDVPLDSLEVTVEADYDARGEMGVGDVSPAYSEVRFIVDIGSPASQESIEKMMQTAEDNCTYLHIFADEQTVKRTVRLQGSEA